MPKTLAIFRNRAAVHVLLDLLQTTLCSFLKSRRNPHSIEDLDCSSISRNSKGFLRLFGANYFGTERLFYKARACSLRAHLINQSPPNQLHLIRGMHRIIENHTNCHGVARGISSEVTGKAGMRTDRRCACANNQSFQSARQSNPRN